MISSSNLISGSAQEACLVQVQAFNLIFPVLTPGKKKRAVFSGFPPSSVNRRALKASAFPQLGVSPDQAQDISCTRGCAGDKSGRHVQVTPTDSSHRDKASLAQLFPRNRAEGRT